MSTQRSTVSESDPFGVDLPTSWTNEVLDRTVVYEDGRGTVRVTIREFAKNLRVYWWIDVLVRASNAGEWDQWEAGAGDTFRDPDAAAARAQRLIEELADGRSLPDLAVEGGASTEAEDAEQPAPAPDADGRA